MKLQGVKWFPILGSNLFDFILILTAESPIELLHLNTGERRAPEGNGFSKTGYGPRGGMIAMGNELQKKSCISTSKGLVKKSQ